MYNGYNTYETWLANLHYGDDLREAFANGRHFRDRYELIDYMKRTIEDSVLENVDEDSLPPILRDMMWASLEEIDYYDLADTYLCDFPRLISLDDEDEEEDYGEEACATA